MSKTIRQENRPATYSVSKLRTFHTCSMMYKYKYVDKIRDNSLTKATLIGSCLHQALEDNYFAFIGIDNPPATLPEQTILKGINDVLSKVFLHDLTEQIAQVYTYYQSIQELYVRASANYTGPNPIRKGDGTVAQAPEMTGTWKKELAKLKVDNIEKELNSYIKSVDARWINLDFFDIVITVLKVGSKFNLDSRIKKIIGVELEFSPETNVIVTPNTTDKGPILEAYIDLVAELDNGEIAIIDYKSGSQDYSEAEIDFNSQLLMYSYAYEQLTGKAPKYIGIYNLRTNKLLLSEMIPAFREQVIEQLTGVHNDIVNGKFEKRLPNKDTANSCPCLDQFHKPCPFLANCYPELAAKLNNPLSSF